MTGLLITGTDTGIGKTVVAAGLICLLRERGVAAVGVKPVETGVPGVVGRWPADIASAQPADATMLRAAADNELSMREVLPEAFAEPLAPSVAAQRLGVTVDFDAIVSAVRTVRDRVPALVAEGAGGIAVPITDSQDYADLARALDLPVLVVARPDLGTINHTALTIRYAQQRGLRVIGFVINGYPADPGVAEQTNPRVIADLTAVPCLGVVPRGDREPDATMAADLCRGTLDVTAISDACGWT